MMQTPELVERPKSKSEWARLGYRLKPTATPSARKYHPPSHRHYYVYFKDQVGPKKKRSTNPPLQLPLTDQNIAQALYEVNKAAKRNRDGASKYYRSRMFGLATYASGQKSEYYELKNRVMCSLIAEGRMSMIGKHNDLILFSFCGYTFHSPLESLPDGTKKQAKEVQDLGILNDLIPSVPTTRHMRIKDAIDVLERYRLESDRLRRSAG